MIYVAEMLKDQQEGVDKIEEHTTAAAAQSQQGVDELREASNYMSKARKKICLIAVVITIIVVGLVVFFGLWFGIFKK